MSQEQIGFPGQSAGQRRIDAGNANKQGSEEEKTTAPDCPVPSEMSLPFLCSLGDLSGMGVKK